MSRPTARVLAVLELLQTGGTHTVADLAERLAVDERTVRRYIEHLRDLDIPVDGTRGRYGGYRLARHYRMPPLMLTDEEALAVVWALLLSGRSRTGPASVLAVDSAAAKVLRVLPATLARRMGAVVETVAFTTSGKGRRDDDDGGHDSVANVLLPLAEAAWGRRPVTFGYTARPGQAAQRSVQPHGVVAHHGRLYLTGFDVTRQAMRTFRLDRIAGVRLLEGTFTTPAGTDPVQQVVGPLAPSPQRHDVSIRIRADIAHVRSRIPETLASVTPVEPGAGNGDGWLRVFLRAERLEWVAGTLAMLDSPFIIEYPEALRNVVTALGQRLITAAGAANGDGATPGQSASLFCAGSADSAPGRASCKRQVSGSNPLTGSQVDRSLPALRRQRGEPGQGFADDVLLGGQPVRLRLGDLHMHSDARRRAVVERGQAPFEDQIRDQAGDRHPRLGDTELLSHREVRVSLRIHRVLAGPTWFDRPDAGPPVREPARIVEQLPHVFRRCVAAYLVFEFRHQEPLSRQCPRAARLVPVQARQVRRPAGGPGR